MVWVTWNWSTSSQWWFPPKITEALILILANPQQTNSLTYMPINIPYTMLPARASPPPPKENNEEFTSKSHTLHGFIILTSLTIHPPHLHWRGRARPVSQPPTDVSFSCAGRVHNSCLSVVIIDMNLEGRPLSQKLSLVYWYTGCRLYVLIVLDSRIMITIRVCPCSQEERERTSWQYNIVKNDNVTQW